MFRPRDTFDMSSNTVQREGKSTMARGETTGIGKSLACQTDFWQSKDVATLQVLTITDE